MLWHFLNISKASYLTSRRLGYQFMNVERKKELKTEKLKKKLETQEKTQAKNSRIRHFFAPNMPRKWPENT